MSLEQFIHSGFIQGTQTSRSNVLGPETFTDTREFTYAGQHSNVQQPDGRALIGAHGGQFPNDGLQQLILAQAPMKRQRQWCWSTKD